MRAPARRASRENSDPCKTNAKSAACKAQQAKSPRPVRQVRRWQSRRWQTRRRQGRIAETGRRQGLVPKQAAGKGPASKQASGKAPAPKHAAAPKQPAGKKAAAPKGGKPAAVAQKGTPKANAAGKGGKGGKNDKPNKPGRGRAAVAAASSAAMPPPASSVRAEAAALRSSTAYVQDLETSTVLFAKNENVVRPIASISKLMTAVVVVDANQPMNEMLEITDDDIDGLKHTTSRLRVGTR